jgi:hypothetical protein
MIFRAVRRLLRANDVIERRNRNCDPRNRDRDCVSSEFVVAGKGGGFEREVEIPEVGREVQDLHPTEERSIRLERDAIRV